MVRGAADIGALTPMTFISEMTPESGPAALAFEWAREAMVVVRVVPSSEVWVVAVNRAFLETLVAGRAVGDASGWSGLAFGEVARRMGMDARSRGEAEGRLRQVAQEGGRLDFDESIPWQAEVWEGRSSVIRMRVDNEGAAWVLYTTREVGAQRRREREAERQQILLSNMLGNLSGMAYRARNDEHWTMEFVSEGLRRLAGYAPEDVVGNNALSWERVIHPDDRAWVRRHFEERARPGLRCEVTYRIVTVEGRTRWVFEQALAIAGEAGEVAMYEGIVTDVTALKEAELAVQEKERVLSAILDHGFQFIGLLDVEGRLLRANRASWMAVGATQEVDVIGRMFWEAPWWADRPEEQARLREAIVRAARGEFVRFQTRHTKPDGSVLNVDFSLKPVFGEAGRVCYLVPEGRDITDIIRAQEASRSSQELFQRAFQSSPNAICISRRSDGLILDVNEAFVADCGLGVDEVRGRTSFELGIWEEASQREAFVAMLRRDGRIRNHLVERVKPDGRRRAMLLSVDPIMVEGEACLLSTAMDVTARMEAERALAASEEKFAKAFIASPYSLTITRLEDGCYLEVNAGFERLSGYRREEALGRTSVELGLWVGPEDRAELLRRVAEHGVVRGMETRLRNRQGEELNVIYNVDPIQLGGQPCLLSVTEDITERRRTEAERRRLEGQLRQNQKLEALGTLAGGIAHDFNNILTAIIMNRELALMDLGDAELVRSRLDAIERASNRARNLVRQILTFSRHQPVVRRRQDLAPLLREVGGFMRASLPATIAIEVVVEETATTACVDENQAHQVLMNLCTNAAHAMGERGGRLRLTLGEVALDEEACRGRPGLAPGDYVRIEVADTGCGMSEEVQARIFEPFFTTKGPGEGTGLGLSLVHGIMRDHQGGVRVSSRPGEGAVFELFFPVGGGAATSAVEASVGVVAGAGQSVLLVDDEPEVVEAMGAMLSKLGYRVERHGDPRAALARLMAAPYAYDVLVTDSTMPSLTGLDLIAAARGLRPGLPAVLMTGLRSSEGIERRATDTWVLLDKPADLAGLSQALLRAIEVQK